MDEEFVEAADTYASDEETDEIEHEKLLKAVSGSYKKGLREIERSESSNIVHEFGLSKRSDDRVELDDLLGSLASKVSMAKVRKKIIIKAKETKTLEVPISKHVAQKTARKAAYEKVCNEVGKWDTIVARNRNADQLTFPLHQPPIYLDSIKDDRFTFKTPLELEMAALLKAKAPLNVVNEELDGKDKWQHVAMEEALALRNEVRKIRARQTYQLAKDKQRRKIKSKNYHRILKREKMRKEAVILEEMQKKNPELLLERLEELATKRASERMSLRHRNTGKWAKHNLLRRKMNLDNGRAIQEQIELSRALTAKQRMEPESESEEEEKVPTQDSEEKTTKIKDLNTDQTNPWFTITKKPSKINEKVSAEKQHDEVEKEKVSYRRYWENVNKNKRQLDEEEEENVAEVEEKVVGEKVEERVKERVEEKEELDPEKFITVEAQKKRVHFEEMEADESGLDDEKSTDLRQVVAEAFADDDLVQQFREEKEAEEEAMKPKDICNVLPGWGEWGGTGLKVSQAKRRKFTVKAAAGPVRKDSRLPHVIINEDADAAIRPHRLPAVPFPFKNREEYEDSIQHPVGKNWNPETAFTRLIAPKVITKPGTIIPPMDESCVPTSQEGEEVNKKLVGRGKAKNSEERKISQSRLKYQNTR